MISVATASEAADGIPPVCLINSAIRATFWLLSSWDTMVPQLLEHGWKFELGRGGAGGSVLLLLRAISQGAAAEDVEETEHSHQSQRLKHYNKAPQNTVNHLEAKHFTYPENPQVQLWPPEVRLQSSPAMS
ncbi:hypothetical protein J5N97_018391 [Dioscorea zingiberensis]|uniref:Uncharacterized protein n=1 Tax=Dioscorea zingiberensis TaxID=325984 RepID=A0A9D5HH67_9LILI|nr:hypothetical protein J5N97_018391 [Dioscorea zingiberensis]